MASTFRRVACPSRIMAPLPNCFSILLSAISSAFCLSTFVPLLEFELLNHRVFGTCRFGIALHEDKSIDCRPADFSDIKCLEDLCGRRFSMVALDPGQSEVRL